MSNVEFVLEDHAVPPEPWEEFVPALAARRAGWRAWFASVPESGSTRVLEFEPGLPGIRITVTEALTQVALHSQHHRGQCSLRLRELDGDPPTVDSIIWLREKPTPA